MKNRLDTFVNIEKGENYTYSNGDGGDDDKSIDDVDGDDDNQ